jgi:hypothetical protein
MIRGRSLRSDLCYPKRSRRHNRRPVAGRSRSQIAASLVRTLSVSLFHQIIASLSDRGRHLRTTSNIRLAMKPLSSIFMVLLAAWLSRLHIKQVGKRRKLIDACLGVFASAMVPSLPIHASHGGDMQSMPARHQGSSSETGAAEARTGSPPRSQHAGSIDVQDSRRYLLPHIASRPALLPAGRLRCRLGAGLFGGVSSLCCEAPQSLFIAAAAPPRRLLAICRK